MRIELSADPASAGTARRAVRSACAETEVDLDSLLLCTSELVTNAVLHGTPPLELVVDIGVATVRVQVRDASEHVAHRRRPMAADTVSGRGLTIVESLTSRWGSELTDNGKVTWFELERGASDAAAGEGHELHER